MFNFEAKLTSTQWKRTFMKALAHLFTPAGFKRENLRLWRQNEGYWEKYEFAAGKWGRSFYINVSHGTEAVPETTYHPLEEIKKNTDLHFLSKVFFRYQECLDIENYAHMTAEIISLASEQLSQYYKSPYGNRIIDYKTNKINCPRGVDQYLYRFDRYILSDESHALHNCYNPYLFHLLMGDSGIELVGKWQLIKRYERYLYHEEIQAEYSHFSRRKNEFSGHDEPYASSNLDTLIGQYFIPFAAQGTSVLWLIAHPTTPFVSLELDWSGEKAASINQLNLHFYEASQMIKR